MWLIKEIGAKAAQGFTSATSYDISLSQLEYNFDSVMTQLDEDIGELTHLFTIKGMEFALIGAALGSAQPRYMF